MNFTPPPPHRKQSYIVILLLVFTVNPLLAQIATRQAGNWNNCDTWPTGRSATPEPTDNVLLNHAVTLSDNQNVGQISFGTNGTLNLNGFAIGFGGADTSASCCSDLTNADAGDADVSISEGGRTGFDSVLGSAADASDGNTGTSRFLVDTDNNPFARVEYTFSFTYDYLTTSYSVRIRGKVAARKRASTGGNAVCEFLTGDSGGAITQRASSSSSSATTSNTVSFNVTIGSTALRQVNASSIVLRLYSTRFRS